MRQTIRDLEESKIREVANAGLGRDDVLAFWFGEGDEVTPDFIRQAAIESLQRGETFYAHNLGLPELRQAIASYLSSQHRLSIGPDRIAEQALRRGTGARGLRAILEEVLLNTMYDLPGRSDVGRVIIDGTTVNEKVNPTLVPREVVPPS